MLPSPGPDDVQWAVARLAASFDPLQIIVFGSYAHGEARPGSDLDLLVVLPTVLDKRKAATAMRRALSALPVPKDVIVATPEELQQRRDSNWHILGIAQREGQVVYQKAGGVCETL
jgi:predicted nucleotidyltransferase